ncbi:phenylacetyl-CoA ligase [Lentinula aff. lateritia]|uniref:Phenylacetyl-CoA ligase n=1 Tax=Lentinula aff. lateritia TaxID=2804960 RepID=A0ACC1TUK1_9AGAR|nr:phenylacetyl-CoA ligase [Lentinula aff. lateritia]
MNIFETTETLPAVPDHLSIPQFFLDYQGNERLVTNGQPVQDLEPNPWFIEERTGRKIGLAEQIRRRSFALAIAISIRYNIASAVLIFSRNHVDYPIAIWAVHRVGGIVSGANPDFVSNELLYQIQVCNAKLILVHPDALETAVTAARSAGITLDRVIVFDVDSKNAPKGFQTVSNLVREGLNQPSNFVEPKIDARTKLAFLSFSSAFKRSNDYAVAIPHFSVIINVIQMAIHFKVFHESAPWHERRFRPGDISIGVLPIYHIYGLILNVRLTIHLQMSLVLVEKFNFVDMLRNIDRYHISHLMLVPPHIVLFCKQTELLKDYALDSVRFIMVGAAPLSNEVNNQLFNIFPKAHIGQAYGMTETCTSVSAFPISKKRGNAGSAGLLKPGVRARILKEDGTFGTFDEPGELHIWSPSNALGYYNNEQATRETFIDGWVRTGDEAKIDRNLELWIMDRMKEIMKVRGFQVAPAELEGCILDHPDVNDACVVGIPDDYSGEVPLAFVVLKTEAAQRAISSIEESARVKASIQKHVSDNKVYYKRLAGGVEIVTTIPKNPSGKLLRRVLREKAKALKKPTTKL